MTGWQSPKRPARAAACTLVVLVVFYGAPVAHASPSGERPTGPVDRRQCAGCHEDVKAHAASHGPVLVNNCFACHRVESVERHTFSIPDDVCTMCHDAPPDREPIVHAPLASGTCIDCHDPHGGADRALLAAPSVDALCRGCHDDVTRAADPAHAADHAALLRNPPHTLCLECRKPIRKTVRTAQVRHSPATDGRGCLHCHTAHSSIHPGLLVSEVNELCLGCHDRDMKRDEGGVVVNVRAELDGAAHVHAPVAHSDCSTCHGSHGGDEIHMLKAAYPELLYIDFEEQRYALCFSCHDPELATAPTTESATGFRNGEVNLHHVHVEKRRTCRICHLAHAGPNDRLVRTSVPYGRAGWNLELGFEMTDDGGSCGRSCHDAAAYGRSEPVGEGQPCISARPWRRCFATA